LELPPGRWVEQLGPRTFEGTVDLATLWADFPVALLVRADA
jgi:maltooligosyltrehalose synthase